MALLGGADEVVVRAVQPLDHGLEARHVAVDQFAAAVMPSLRRGLLDLLAVLVGAGEEEHVVAVEPHEARDGVGRDHLIGMPDMRRAVRIGDRGRDVIAGLFGHVAALVSTARRLGKRPHAINPRCFGQTEHRKHQRLALEIVGLGVARRAVELVPDLGDAREPRGLLRPHDDAGAEPVAHRIDEGRERALVAAPERVAERVQRARIDRRQRARAGALTCSRTLQRVAAEQVERARDAAVGGGGRGLDLGARRRRARAPRRPRARRPRRRAGAASSVRQRERMVGSRRPGAWLTSSSSARGGGSSRIFSSALAPAAFSSSGGSTMQTRQPPSPAVEPKKRTVRRTSSTAMTVRSLPLFVDRRAPAPEDRCAPARRCAAPPDGRPARASEVALLHRRRGRIGMGEHEARHAIGERRLADAARAADQPGMRHAAAAIGIEQRLLGLGMAEQRRCVARGCGIVARRRVAHDARRPRISDRRVGRMEPRRSPPPRRTRRPSRLRRRRIDQRRSAPARARRASR